MRSRTFPTLVRLRGPWLALCILLASAPARAAGEAGSWYAQRVTAGDTPLRIEYFWSDERKLRMQTVIRGQPLVTLVRGDSYYVIDPVQRRGIRVRRSRAALELEREETAQRPFGNEAARVVAAGAERVGEERIGGVKCLRYRLTDQFGRREVWVTEDGLQVPRRLVQFDRRSGATIRQEYMDWAQQLELPERFFEPDPDIEIDRLDYAEYMEEGNAANSRLPILLPELFHGRPAE